MKKKLVIITGVSASGKTTIQDELIARGWNRPLNFTTRKPRTEDAYEIDNEGDYISKELTEYAFLSQEQFFFKLKKGDFLENTNYGGNFYGVSSNLPKEGNTCVILDPVGRSQVLEKSARGEIDVDIDCYYIECSEELQAERLTNRGDTEEEITKRKRDFKWFAPGKGDMVIDGSWSTKALADIIEGFSLKKEK